MKIVKFCILFAIIFVLFSSIIGAAFCQTYSDEAENPPVFLYDDNLSFWTWGGFGEGNISATVSKSEGVTRNGNQSLQISLTQGQNLEVEVGHFFNLTQDWASYDYLHFWIKGANSGDLITLAIAAPDGENQYWASFRDNFTSWTQFEYEFSSMNKWGTPNLSNITEIGFFFFDAPNTLYIDKLTLDSNSEPEATPTMQPPPNDEVEPIVFVGIVGGATAAVAAGAFVFKDAIIAVIHNFLGGGAGAPPPSSAPPPSPPPSAPPPIGSVDVPIGTGVSVQPHANVQLTFNEVIEAGSAIATPTSSFPSLPGKGMFLGEVFEVTTSAVFTGGVLVGLLFAANELSDKQKKKLRVYRYDPKEGSEWIDVTEKIDTKKNIAYGRTDHFSIFGVR